MIEIPLVSICIAAHNGEKTISEAIESAQLQDYKNLEILINDDSSVDSTFEICSQYAQTDSRIKLSRNEVNLGIIRNYNSLIEMANGKYLVFFDQDDTRPDGAISGAISIMEADHFCVLCHSKTGVYFRNQLMKINTLEHLSRSDTLVSRIFQLLRRPSDINGYGVIRSNTLKSIGGLQESNSAFNAMLFALALQGTIRQTETIGFNYSAKGPHLRLNYVEELQRAVGDRTRIISKFGILIELPKTYSLTIRKSHLPSFTKYFLQIMVWSSFLAQGFLKSIYRILFKIFLGKTPRFLDSLFIFLIQPTDELDQVVNHELYNFCHPKGWPLVSR
jgi:glycosyltransferase involved in cell wall biosynthesis